MKTKCFLAILISFSSLLTACQPASNSPTATIVPFTDTPIPTNTLDPTSTTIPSTPTLAPSTSTTIGPENFIVYDSSTDKTIDEFGLRERIPDFSIKYPPEWQYGWFGDSGIIALIISSGDPYDAFTLQDKSGFMIMIIPNSYDGQELTDLFLGYGSADSIVQEPSALMINSQDAMRVEFMNNGSSQVEVVIVQGKSALTIVGQIQTDKEAEFRPLLEEMINTVEIK